MYTKSHHVPASPPTNCTFTKRLNSFVYIFMIFSVFFFFSIIFKSFLLRNENVSDICLMMYKHIVCVCIICIWQLVWLCENEYGKWKTLLQGNGKVLSVHIWKIPCRIFLSKSKICHTDGENANVNANIFTIYHEFFSFLSR